MKQYILVILAALFSLTAKAQISLINQGFEGVVAYYHAIERQDWPTLSEVTLPQALKEAGGKSAFEADLGGTFSELEIISLDLARPQLAHQGKNYSFVVYPVALEVATEGVKMVSRSFLLGVYDHDQDAWYFMDGEGEGMRTKLITWLGEGPDTLALPQPSNQFVALD